MSAFNWQGQPATCGPSAQEKAQKRARAKRLLLEVPDAKGSNPINQFAPLSIEIAPRDRDSGAKTQRISKAGI